MSSDATGEPVPADVPALQRQVRLREEDWALIRWRPRGSVRKPAVRPFDLEDGLRRMEAICPHGWVRQDRVPANLPERLSREEAWFWLHSLDLRSRPRGRPEDLRAAHAAAGQPCDDDVRAWAAQVAERPDFVYYDVPHILLPFFTPAQIAALILRRFEWDLSRERSPELFAPATGFSRHIVCRLDEEERASLRVALEHTCDAGTDPTAATAALALALLSTVGAGQRLSDYIAGQPDGAWAAAYGAGWYRRPRGHLELLAGLDSEEAFLREARRLGCRPLRSSDRRLWLAAGEWRALEVLKAQALAATTREAAAAVTRDLALVAAPEAALPMLEVLLASKAPALAAAWLSAHPLHAAVGLTPAAMGQGRLAQPAREQLRTLKDRGHAAALTAALQHLTPDEGAWLRREILEAREEGPAEIGAAEMPEALRAALAAVKAARLPAWITPSSLPPVILQGGRLGVPDLGRVLAALAQKPAGAATGPGAALLAALKAHIDATALDAFAWRLFELWLAMGAPSRDKWALWAIGCLGGDGCVLKLTPLLRAWPGESQHARAVSGLACLRQIGSDSALMALNGIAQKLRYKGLKQQAQAMMEDIAAKRGLSAQQLADRIVPDCGLDERGSRVFDFGPRQFRFVLGSHMKALLRDGAGRLRTDLPAPTKADDPDKAAAAVAGWKLMKKTLREVLKVQAERLEDAMISGRRWTAAEFQTLLVRHPLMVNLVRQLVLAAYDTEGRLIATFRVTEDQGFADPHDEETLLPAAAHIGVAHPAHLDQGLKSAWRQVLDDYEIIPPFPQLAREISRPDQGELDQTQIIRFKGPKIPGVVLYGVLERSHWLRDTPADGGGFMQHSKHFPAAGLTAFISYSPGLSIGWLDEPQEIDAIYFVPGHVMPGHWGRHENRIRIREVDPVVLSEVLRLAHAITARA